mgnify:CR=1 FL=1
MIREEASTSCIAASPRPLQFYVNCADQIASRRSDPPMRRDAYLFRVYFMTEFGQKKWPQPPPAFGLPLFQMNSNALEPANPSLVGHPPIIASSIALTNSICALELTATTAESLLSTSHQFNRGINKKQFVENHILNRMLLKSVNWRKKSSRLVLFRP